MKTSALYNIEQQLRDVTDLISLPEIYLKIRRLMDDNTSDIEDFAEVIRLDPNLSVSVLKMVNSAYFGFPEKIDSVSQAINMIGIGQLHNMVLGISAISSLDLPNDIMPLKTFWRCSLYAGVFSRLLARHLKIRHSERLFIMGLLHDIGHLVLYAKFPDQYRQAIQIAQTNSIAMHEAESQVLGCHYGEIGAMLMAQWGLSTDYQLATSYQPTPQSATANPVEIGLLHLAHGYAQQQIIVNDITADMLITPVAWEMTRLSPEEVDNSLELARTLSSELERVIKI